MANANALAIFKINTTDHKRLHLNVTEKNVFSLIATGDLMMTARVQPLIKKYGVHYPFDQTRNLLQKANIAMTNLEAPFSRSGLPFKKKYTFRTPPSYIAGICSSGIDLFTLANNHMMDYGVQGLETTLTLLDQHALYHCGAGLNRKQAEAASIVQVNKRKIAFVAYSLTYPEEFWAKNNKAGTAYPHETRIIKHIRMLKKENDAVVVSFHWGGERLVHPKNYQKNYAHRVIDAGADIVIGHHPHVLQGFEIYKNKLIAYSLGNYVFGSYSHTVDYSVLLKIWFDDNGPLLASLYPIDINNYRVAFQPRFLSDDKNKDLFTYLNGLSRDLNKNNDIISQTGCIRIQ